MDLDGYLTGAPRDLYRPHVILPAQHFNPPQKLTLEHRLMMGVLRWSHHGRHHAAYVAGANATLEKLAAAREQRDSSAINHPTVQVSI